MWVVGGESELVKQRQRRRRTRSQGFTLVEVLIAILVASLFFILALQATTIGLFSKAQSLETTQALTWIQEDIERLRQVATTYQVTRLSEDAGTGATRIRVVSTADLSPDLKNGDTFKFRSPKNFDNQIYEVVGTPSGDEIQIKSSEGLKVQHDAGDAIALVARNVAFGAGGPANNQVNLSSPTTAVSLDSKIRVGIDPSIYTITGILGNQLNVSPSLNTTVPTDTSIGVSPCDVVAKNEGLAAGLLAKILGTPSGTAYPTDDATTVNKTTSSNKQFQMIRTITIPDSPPYNVPPFNLLLINYDIQPSSSGAPTPLDSPVVTEVIPDAAFFCP
jgi:prepilin-type N-terminal cleavage/methylation domain-containing protein